MTPAAGIQSVAVTVGDTLPTCLASGHGVYEPQNALAVWRVSGAAGRLASLPRPPQRAHRAHLIYLSRFFRSLARSPRVCRQSSSRAVRSGSARPGQLARPVSRPGLVRESGRPFSAETKQQDPIPREPLHRSMPDLCIAKICLLLACLAAWLAWCLTPAAAVVGSPWQSLSVARLLLALRPKYRKTSRGCTTTYLVTSTMSPRPW